MKKGAGKHDREIEALIRMRDEDINTDDIPEVTDWDNAVVGRFYRPMKEPVSIRLDVDVVAWLKSEGRGYQTRINTLLRDAMTRMSSSSRLRIDSEENDLEFPTLERNGELQKSNDIAQRIERRGSLFAPAC